MTDSETRELLAALLGACVQDRAVCGWEYMLIEDRCVPIAPHLPPQGPFVAEWGSILGGTGWGIMLRECYATDGCTAAPDFSEGATLSRCLYALQTEGPEAALRLAGPFVAHWCHDFIYQHAVEIAAAWGCSVWAVIRWANELFNWHMQICGTPRAQRLAYYWAVCLVGHQFAWVGRQKRALVKIIKGKRK